MKRRILIFLLFALTVITLSQAGPTRAQTNLLQNPGFEFPYGDRGEANSWGRWHRNSSEDQFGDCENGYHKRPNWSAETNSALVHSGGVSQHVGNQWDTWNAGVFQTVPVTSGSTYRFTVWIYSFGSMENFPGPSDFSLNSNARVGIDPNGSGTWNDADVVWSGAINPLDGWQPISIEVTATGNQISVFTSANWGVQGVNQCRAHLDTWFDSAELIEVGPPPTNTPPPVPTQPPPPPVTNTPIPPTATPTSEVPATETPVPTETPIPTDTPAPGGSICLNAFADENGNGVHDENEGQMGSVTFTIASNTDLIGQAVSTGTEEPVCFDGVPAGAYMITQLVPSALEMTTAANTNVNLVEGQVIGVEFGSRLHAANLEPVTTEVAELPEDGAVEAPGAENSSGRLNFITIGGVALIVIALLLLIGLVFLLLRRQHSA